MKAQYSACSGSIKTLLSILIPALCLATEASSTEIKVNYQVNVRQENGPSKILKTVGQLPIGTVVQVPEGELKDQYDLIKATDSEELLLEWLLRAGTIFEFEGQKGNIKKDYFFPVEVVSNKNHKIEKGSIVYVPIRFLIEKQGIELITDNSADVVAIKKPGQKKWKFSFSELKRSLSSNSRHVEISKQQAFMTRRFHEEFILGGNCAVSNDTFHKVAFEYSDYYKVPKEVIFSMLEMESSGDCMAIRSELDGSKSVGLFQLNTKTTETPICDKDQLNRLKLVKNEKDLYDPKVACLQNPLINLREAMKTMRNKYSRVNEQGQPSVAQWNLMGRQARDGWRKAIAAYNGGEAYLFQAWNDIDSINQYFGAHLDANDWEVRRLALMRNMLSPREEARYFKSPQKFTRHKRLTYMNIIYVETITGRENRDVFAQNSIVAKWTGQIYGPQNIPVVAKKTKPSCWFCKENLAFMMD